MIDLLFALIAIGVGSAGGGADHGVVKAAPEAPSTPAYVAEDQTPTGKFTTAVEVKPILAATRANWVAVREYEGQDLVYFSHLLAWRCGLVGVRYAINGGAQKDWPLAPCQIDTAQPNAIPRDARIYESHALKSVETISVELIYDDLTRETAVFSRKSVLMP